MFSKAFSRFLSVIHVAASVATLAAFASSFMPQEVSQPQQVDIVIPAYICQPDDTDK